MSDKNRVVLKNMPENLIEICKWYSRYDVRENYILEKNGNNINFLKREGDTISENKNTSGDKIFIGNNKNRVCRFCGKNENETSFKKKAHAVPELIGNNQCFLNEECDKCNEYFSNFENSLAEFTSFKRTISGTKGKKGFARYNSNGTKLKYDVDENNFPVISMIENNTFNERLQEIIKTKELNIEVKNNFIPINLYKILLKMFLSLLKNENDIKECEWLARWLLSYENSKEYKEIFSKIYFKTFINLYPLTKSKKNLHTILKARDSSLLPLYTYFVRFADVSF